MNAHQPAEHGPTDDRLDDDGSRRRCGRCRQLFIAEPGLHATAIAEWWACDPCRLKLFDRS